MNFCLSQCTAEPTGHTGRNNKSLCKDAGSKVALWFLVNRTCSKLGRELSTDLFRFYFKCSLIRLVPSLTRHVAFLFSWFFIVLFIYFPGGICCLFCLFSTFCTIRKTHANCPVHDFREIILDLRQVNFTEPLSRWTWLMPLTAMTMFVFSVIWYDWLLGLIATW